MNTAKGPFNVLLLHLLFSLLVASGCAMGMRSTEAVWKTIPEITQTEYESAWTVIVGTISERYDLEVIDANSGYLRSSWKEGVDYEEEDGSRGSCCIGSVSQTRIQTRIVVRVISREPLKIKLKAEKQLWDSNGNHWMDDGNNEKVESEILEELAARLK